MESDRTISASNEGMDEENDGKSMTIFEHLDELRKHLVVILIAVVVATLVSIVIVTRVFDILKAPIPPGVEVIAVDVTEMFTTYIKVALFTGIILAMPVIVHQLGSFIMPGLTKKEKRYLMMLVPGVFASFIFGIVFGYYVVVPFAVRYLLTAEFLTHIAQPMIRISNYIGFVVNLLLAIGISFELPVVVFFLTKIGIVTTEKLVRYRKFAILGAAIAGAIITPTPDPGTQMLVAIPLYFLYEVGVLLSRVAKP